MALVLYGTEACHLCELAQQVIVSVAQQLNCAVYVEDITSDPTLFERYSQRIPVLYDEDTQAELNWPFDQAGLLNWFQTLKR